jgi:hypothetical protein
LFKKKISFQILLVQSYLTAKTFIIFNYDKRFFSWNDQSNFVLFGYTDGIKPLVGGISRFSNTYDVSISPSEIFTAVGNASKLYNQMY